MTKVKQTQLRRFMFIVKRNYSKSGILNTRRYAKFIEPVFEKILINHYGDNWNYFWKNSNTLTRIHFFYILSIPFWYFVFIQIAFDTEEISSQFFFAIWPLIAVVLMYMGIMIVVNIVFYYFAISLLGLFKFESGILNRNVSALEGVTDSIKFYKNSAIILGISGILSSFFISKAAGFKGMGGGKFGGGGASGKW